MRPRRVRRGHLALALLAAVAVSACLPASGANPGGPSAPPGPATSTAPSAAAPAAGLDQDADGLGLPIEGQPGGGQPGTPALPGIGVPGAGLPAPAVSTPAPTPVLPRPTESFAMNLYGSGDFVAQYTFEWCVGASIQMALNMLGANDRTRARQQELWTLAQSLSESPFGGANARGWTLALNAVGVGPYELVSEPDLDAAIRHAAAAMRETHKPVGLLMWRGRHAWVMSGFTSLGDPASAPNFEVTGVRVLDPLYPHGDDVWGPSPKPNALLDPETLGQQFVARLNGRVDYGVPPGYFLILPRVA